MGLCKCPKKKVTNQFCFEHRVNVCESCIISNHRSCVVQSYLQWLKDSDYDASCKICVKNLDTSDCVRLVCYHVFHWNCLDERESNLPINTAPSGHLCPSCRSPIFPPPNLVSPIADALRVRLGQVNWGRNELGLPLFSEEFTQKMAQQHHSMEKDNSSSLNGTAFVHNSAAGHHRQNIATESPHSVVNMIESYSAVNEPMSSRRPLLQREQPIGAADRDDNKYKRKTPQEIFSRWSRRLYAPASIPPWRRTWFIILAGFLIFCCMIYLMYIFGRRSTNNDPMLDINNNPNLIHDDE